MGSRKTWGGGLQKQANDSDRNQNVCIRVRFVPPFHIHLRNIPKCGAGGSMRAEGRGEGAADSNTGPSAAGLACLVANRTA